MPRALPKPRSTFFGRIAERERLERALLDGAPVVTVTGLAGVGKSRLAIEIARVEHELRGRSVQYVDLGSIDQGVAFDERVAQECGVELVGALSEEDRAERIGLAFAASPGLLVILDNADRCVEHAARAVGRWLLVGGDAQWIVTSREALGVEGEILLPLHGLDAATSAALFEDRARSRALSTIERDDAAALAIGKRLEGLPLAIELAAARTSILPPSEISHRIDESLSLLKDDRRDRDPRHGTLDAALRWSWERLEPLERSVLCAASIVEHGFTFRLASGLVENTVTEAEVLDALQGLVRRSWIEVDAEGSAKDGARYRTTRIVRDFLAPLRAPILPSLEERLITRFADDSRRALAAVASNGDQRWHRWLFEERDNARAVARLAFDVAPARAIAILEAFVLALVETPCDDDLWSALPNAIEACAGDPRAELAGASILALVYRRSGRRDEALRLVERALRGAEEARRTLGIEPEPWPLARLFLVESGIRLRLGDNELGRVYAERAHEVALASKNHLLASAATANALVVAHLERDTASAKAFAERALLEARGSGFVPGLGLALSNLSDQRLAQHDPTDALALADEACAIAHEAGSLGSEMAAETRRGAALHALGRNAEASEAYARALALEAMLGRAGPAALATALWGVLRLDEGAPEEGLSLLLEAMHGIDLTSSDHFRWVIEAFLAAAEALVGRAEEAAERLESVRAHASSVREPGILDGVEGVVWAAVYAQATERSSTRRAADSFAAARRAKDRVSTSRDRDGLTFLGAVASRLLERSFERITGGGRAREKGATSSIEIEANGLWFRKDEGAPVRVSARGPLGLLLVALAKARVEAPGQPVDAESLIRMGWPGQRVSGEPARNRLRVAIRTLRAMGLANSLLTERGGYLFDPRHELIQSG